MGAKRGCPAFMDLFIQTHSFNKYFMNSHYEPGTVMTRTSMALAPTELSDHSVVGLDTGEYMAIHAASW